MSGPADLGECHKVHFGDVERLVKLPNQADLTWMTHEAINELGIERKERRFLSETSTQVVWEQDVVKLLYSRPFTDARLGGPRLYNKSGDSAHLPWITTQASI